MSQLTAICNVLQFLCDYSFSSTRYRSRTFPAFAHFVPLNIRGHDLIYRENFVSIMDVIRLSVSSLCRKIKM